MLKQKHKNRHQSHGSNDSAISIQDIEELAYRIHEERGGTDLENWLEAEQILKERYCS